MSGFFPNMLVHAILLLAAAPVAENVATRRAGPVRMATASVTIIQAERVAPERNRTEPQKQDRQIRKRDDKPLIEFY